MDKAGLVNKLAISAALAKIAAGKTLKSVVDVIAKALANNESVTLAGFGSFSVTTRATHTVRPPPLKKNGNGCKTGDLVKALVNKGKKLGTYVGRVSVRKSGSFNIKTEAGTIQGIAWKHCSLLQRGDGYSYYRGDRVSSSA